MMTKDEKTFYWFVLGVRAYRAMKEGKLATAAKLMRIGLQNEIFEPDDKDGSSWRTSIILNYKLTHRRGKRWIKGDI